MALLPVGMVEILYEKEVKEVTKEMPERRLVDWMVADLGALVSLAVVVVMLSTLRVAKMTSR